MNIGSRVQRTIDFQIFAGIQHQIVLTVICAAIAACQDIVVHFYAAAHIEAAILINARAGNTVIGIIYCVAGDGKVVGVQGTAVHIKDTGGTSVRPVTANATDRAVCERQRAFVIDHITCAVISCKTAAELFIIQIYGNCHARWDIHIALCGIIIVECISAARQLVARLAVTVRCQRAERLARRARGKRRGSEYGQRYQNRKQQAQGFFQMFHKLPPSNPRSIDPCKAILRRNKVHCGIGGAITGSVFAGSGGGVIE